MFLFNRLYVELTVTINTANCIFPIIIVSMVQNVRLILCRAALRRMLRVLQHLGLHYLWPQQMLQHLCL